MIEVKDLRKIYKTKKGVVVKALDGVSLKLPETGMVFILGKSGSGKSTLLNVVGGLDSIDSGEIIIKGTSAKDFKQSHYDSYRNTYIGFIFQEYNILDELTVGANIALAIELQGRKATNEEINEILKEVDLDGYGGRKPNELSGGQKQRVAIARALVKKPEIIMADEPTGALDSTTGKQVFDTLKKLSSNKLVLIVSHDREFSEQYADRIIELSDGKVISDVEKLENREESEESSDEFITYGDAEISIKKGYSLTEEDRLAINEYLKSLSEDATIKLSDKKAKKQVTSKDFVPTDEGKIINNKNGDFKLIKSKLSMKNAFKLGSGGLKHKKFRLVFTIFLSLIAFTLFGLADTIAAYDSIGTAANSIYDTGVSYASFVKEIKMVYGTGENDYSWNDYNTYLSLADISSIKEKTGIDIVGVYNKNTSLVFSNNIGDEKSDLDCEALYSNRFSGFIPADEEFFNSRGFTLYGRTPAANTNEIVISAFIYDYFKEVGYRSTETGETKKIEKYEDLIGESLTIGAGSEYEIVGIADTNFDYSRYLPLADKMSQNTMNALVLMALSEELSSAKNYSYACLCFVNESFIEELISENAGMAEQISGQLRIAYVKDSSNEDVFDYENIETEAYFYGIYAFSDVKNNIVWLGDAKESLSDNQLVVPAEKLLSLISSEKGNYIFYDETVLVGFEKTLRERSQSGEYGIDVYNLESILNEIRFYTAYKFAFENADAAKAKLWEYIQSQEQWIQEQPFEFSDEKYFPTYFAQNVSSGFTYPELDSQITAYVNSLVSVYGLEDYLVPAEVAKSLVTTVTYNGDSYTTYDYTSFLIFNSGSSYTIEEAIAKKYAAENISDAIKFAKLNNNFYEHISAEALINNYSNYLLGYHSVNTEFTPESSVKFDVYKAQQLINLYKALNSERPGFFMWEKYSENRESIVRDFEIAGVMISSDSKASTEALVVSDTLAGEILGANRGGIYSFALGDMPEEKAEIHSLITFSKEEFNGNHRFSVVNNVTRELSMIDEMLAILGQVFLYIGIGFAVFASLMLTNFIGTSIAHKKQDIGILRAIGSRSADVFRIFFAESFIIAMINYVLSIAGTFSVTMLLNNILRNDAGLLITFLNFGIRQVAVLLAVSVAVAFIATFFPVKKIASMKPIDAIKNRK